MLQLKSLQSRQEQLPPAAILAERARIARDLHDTVAQSLSGIVAQLEAAHEIFHQEPEKSQLHLLRARHLASESLLQARRAVWELRNEFLQQEGLAKTLLLFAKKIARENHIAVPFRVSGTENSLSEHACEQLLLIAQEAVINAVKHAHAAQIRVELRFTSVSVELLISDNGKGFEDSSAPSSINGHFGLVGMRERAKQLGGNLKLSTKPGHGTRIKVRIP